MSPCSAVECYPCREVPLNYIRLLLFHGGNTDSTPVRDAKFQSLALQRGVAPGDFFGKFVGFGGISATERAFVLHVLIDVEALLNTSLWLPLVD